MKPRATFETYASDFRPRLARIFNDLFLAIGTKNCLESGRFNSVSRGHTYRKNLEINSLSFFNPSCPALETIEVALDHNTLWQPVITIGGLNSKHITILSEGIPEADEKALRFEFAHLLHH